MTDDTVLEEHYENPDTVQMRILGEGGEHCDDIQECLLSKTKNHFQCLMIIIIFSD